MMAANDSLRAGAAEVWPGAITPATGVHMGGDAARLRPVEKVLDPLYARALVVEQADGETLHRVCLLSLDLCTPGDEISDEIRSAVASRFGFDRRAVMFHLTQNHSAPSLGTHQLLRPDSPYAREEIWWSYQGDPTYADFLKPRIMQVVERAVANLQPVCIGIGGMADSRVAFNRRFIMRDGWVQTQARDRSAVLCSEGPVDPEVGVACFRNRDGQVIAALLHHTAHPVSCFGENWVTASWPGAWASRFRATAGEACIPLIINGACGNINARDNLNPAHQASDEQIGQWLTDTAAQVMESMTWSDGDKVGFASHTITFPFEPIEKTLGRDAIDHARKVIEAEPEPRWANDAHTAVDIEWLFALYTLDLERRTKHGTYDYEVQALRIGDLSVVGRTGEQVGEGQNSSKKKNCIKKLLS